MKKLVLFLIHGYSVLISPLIHQSLGIAPGLGCRFNPSCSKYALNAVKEYGILRGSIKSLKRLLTCQPFFHGKHI